MRPIRVVIADDHHLVRHGIRQVLQGNQDIEVVGEADNGDEAIRLVENLRPDVLVLDISMPGQSGILIAKHISTAPEPQSARDGRPNRPAILMLSVHDQREYVVEAIRAGARGYLRKDTEPSELRRAIRTLAQGDSYFSPTVARHLSAALQGTDQPAERLQLLTAREREVFSGIAGGQTNREIAGALGLSPRTVESYRESLMRKLGVYTVAGLARLAVETEHRDP